MTMLQKLSKLRAGERVVCDDEFLDSIGCDTVNDLDIVTCLNAKRLGIHGKYVAWIGDENKPKDLRYDRESGFQYGSA